MIIGRRSNPGSKGQSLVEFVLILPVLLLLLLGIVEFGLLLYNQHVITNASREGARYGIVSRTPRRSYDEIKAVVDSYCQDHLVTFGDQAPETAVSPSPTGGAFGEDLTVLVTFRYQFLVLPQFLGDLTGITDLQATTMMKYE